MTWNTAIQFAISRCSLTTRYCAINQVLECVRIEFAGSEALKDNELNGLTLGGCGSDTLIRNVQIHRTLDDGIEIFGGSDEFWDKSAKYVGAVRPGSRQAWWKGWTSFSLN